MTETFTLMNKDVPLSTFKLCTIGTFDLEVTDICIVTDSPYNTSMKIEELLQEKLPYTGREYIESLLKWLHITNVVEYFTYTYGVSFNDTLWLLPQGKTNEVSWSDINPFKRKPDQATAHFCLTGQSVRWKEMEQGSPEFVTDGALPKCWVEAGDTIRLCKGGTSGFANTGNEPFSEYLVSQLLEAAEFENFVKYDLTMLYGKVVSSCKLFTSEDYGFSSFNSIYEDASFQDILDIMDTTGFRSQFNDLIVIDALIYNSDRHLRNFGFITDNKNFTMESLAPVFDNGMGLFPYYTDKHNILNYERKHSYNNYGIKFDDVLYLCLEERHKKLLNNLYGFKFKRHPLLKYTDERLHMLDGVVQRRIEHICSL